MDHNLESLYIEARSALKAKDYERASDLLRQILKTDVDYKDAAQLLARAIKLSRRRWYKDPRFWGAVMVLFLVGLSIYLVPRLQGQSTQAKPIPVISPTSTLAPTLVAPDIATATTTLLPTPTPIPLTWKRVYIGQEFDRDKIIAFEIDPKDPDVLYVRMENAGFYHSIDGGVSWQPIQIEDIPSGIDTKLSISHDHNQDGEYTVKNTAPDGNTRIYNRSWNGANWQVSENDSQTWNEFGVVGKPPSSAITFDSEGFVYTYCDSSLCKYSPDGKQWLELGKPDVGAFTIIAISPHDPNTIYITGQGLAVSKDGGVTWSKLNNGLGTIILTLETVEGNPPILYLQVGPCNEQDRAWTGLSNPVTDPGQPLYASTDGGQTWKLVLQGECHLIKDSDGLTLYRIGQSYEWHEGAIDGKVWIWRSQDRGNSWEKLSVPVLADTLTADLSQSGSVYFYSRVYDSNSEFWPSYELVSEDYGRHWRKIDTLKPTKLCYGLTPQYIDKYRPMAIDPLDRNHVFVIDDGVMLESKDSCETTKVFKTDPSLSMNSIVFDPNDPATLYTGTNEGAYISFDSGETWSQINDGLLGATVVYSIVADKDSNVYAATPYGIFKLESK